MVNIIIKGVDYVELYVSNICQSAYFYRTALGFKQVAYIDTVPNNRSQVSLLMIQNNIRLILSSSSDANSSVSKYIQHHGDGIKDIAFTVDNAKTAYEIAVKRGAVSVLKPIICQDDRGYFIKSSIKTFGDTIHSFIERHNNCEYYFPNSNLIFKNLSAAPINLFEIDHFAVCVEAGKLNYWVDFYKNIFNFHESHEENIYTGISGMNSKVVQSKSGNIKIPITEPLIGKGKSQIEEYLLSYGGAGVQHLAFLSKNIISSVKVLLENGIDFLSIPDAYYEIKKTYFNEINEDIDILKKLQILIDKDDKGYLLQIFTKPIQSRPTFFVEIIERRQAEGFGSGNIMALFQAIEQEQIQRGIF